MKELNQLEIYAKENHVPIMMKEGIEFLLSYIEKKNVRSILEIGTAIGYSAIRMASVNKDIVIDSLEVDENRFNEAVLNVKASGCETQISLYLQDASTFQPDRTYDLIFVDAAKSQYRRYMETFMPYLNQKGSYFFDNLMFHGMVDDPSLTRNRGTLAMVRKIKQFREWIISNPEFETIYFPEIGDGIAIVSIKKIVDMIE